MLDMLVRNATLPDGRKGIDIAVENGKISAIGESIQTPAKQQIDAAGCLVTPPFVDSHFHMDSALSLGQPRLNQSGTLLEGIQIWGELKPDLTVEAIKQRALQMCRWSIARGTLCIRSHVDICDDRLLAVQALLEVREEMKPYLDLQLVAFPQDGFLRYGRSRENLLRALDMGVDVVGASRILSALWTRVPVLYASYVRSPNSVGCRLICTAMKVMTRTPGISKPWRLRLSASDYRAGLLAPT